MTSAAPAALLSFDPAQLSPAEVYKFLIGGIVPRPIALISTLNEDGGVNLAPFSFFNGVSSNPPALMVSISRKPLKARAADPAPTVDPSQKDTLRNILFTNELVVNTVSEEMAERMHACGVDYPYGVSEMAKVGFTPLPSDVVAPPRVKESPLHFECRLLQHLNVGDGVSPGSATVVIAQIVKIHVIANAYQNGHLLPQALRPIARMGGSVYARAYPPHGGFFDLGKRG